MQIREKINLKPLSAVAQITCSLLRAELWQNEHQSTAPAEEGGAAPCHCCACAWIIRNRPCSVVIIYQMIWLVTKLLHLKFVLFEKDGVKVDRWISRDSPEKQNRQDVDGRINRETERYRLLWRTRLMDAEAQVPNWQGRLAGGPGAAAVSVHGQHTGRTLAQAVSIFLKLRTSIYWPRLTHIMGREV